MPFRSTGQTWFLVRLDGVGGESGGARSLGGSPRSAPCQEANFTWGNLGYEQAGRTIHLRSISDRTCF